MCQLFSYLYVKYVPLSFCQKFNFDTFKVFTIVLFSSGFFFIKQNAFYTLLSNRTYKIKYVERANVEPQ